MLPGSGQKEQRFLLRRPPSHWHGVRPYTLLVTSVDDILSGMRRFNSLHKKSVSLLQRMDTELGPLFGCISAWVTKLDAYSTFPTLKIKDLQRISCIWMKNKDVIEHTLAVLSPPDEPNSVESLPSL